MYLPLASLAVLLVLGTHRLLKDFGARVTSAAVLVLCVVLGAVSYVRAQDYQLLRLLAQTTVDRWPNGRGRYHLGVELLDAGLTSEGMRQLELAAPEFPARPLRARRPASVREPDERGAHRARGLRRAQLDHPNAVAGARPAGPHPPQPGAHRRVDSAVPHRPAVHRGIRSGPRSRRCASRPNRCAAATEVSTRSPPSAGQPDGPISRASSVSSAAISVARRVSRCLDCSTTGNSPPTGGPP